MALNEKIISRLPLNELFLSVSPSSLVQLLNCDNSFFAEYKNGELIYSSEKYVEAIGFVVSGEARVMKKGSNLIVGRLSENDIFGFQSLFVGKGYFLNEIVASADTLILYIRKTAIAALMSSEKAFALDYVRLLSKRVYFLNQKIRSLTGGSAESRLADFLLTNFGDYKTFVLDISMSQLAFCLDIGRASLYRAFDSLTECGAVEKEGKLIRLKNRQKLESFVK